MNFPKEYNVKSYSVAKKRYQKIAQQIHPDKGGNKEAFIILKEIYENMTDYDCGEEE